MVLHWEEEMKVRGRSLERASWQASRSKATSANKAGENVGRENMQVAMYGIEGPHPWLLKYNGVAWGRGNEGAWKVA